MEKVSKDVLGNKRDEEKLDVFFWPRYLSLSGRCELGSNVRCELGSNVLVEHPLAVTKSGFRNFLRALMIWSTLIAAPQGPYLVYHPLLVEEGKEHLLQLASLDLFLGGAWIALFQHFGLNFCFWSVHSTADSYMLTMLPRIFLPLYIYDHLKKEGLPSLLHLLQRHLGP